MSVAERRAAGRAARATVPRRALSALGERPAGYDSVARLLEQGEGRVAALAPLRYSRMAVSAFAFLRGAALVMSDDLVIAASTGIDVTLCGDAHAANFGVFTSPERRLVFDVNDFDEVDEGPFEFDVKRLATSIAVVGDEVGLGEAERRAAVEALAIEYQRSIGRFATAGRLAVWYAALDVERDLADLRGFFTVGAARAVDRVIRRARADDERHFEQLVDYESGTPRFRPAPPLVTPIDDDPSRVTRAQLEEALGRYPESLLSDRRALLSQFSLVDVARLVRGVGSVGTECFGALYVGRDDEDALVLQVKEAQRSALATARGLSGTTDGGRRVVEGQRLLQATPDALLCWTDGPVGRSFYVRQLYDDRASVDLARLSARSLAAYGRVCAWTLARAHARGGRSAEIAGYVGEGRQFARCVGEFALAYAERNRADHRALVAAIADRRVPTAT
ncbi:MAG TPA: DUF2252 domain-containing protein [Acidimicrobiales bacterium]|nr:DUF2252 domain-containing protein [Acidimicrobiales bacterium]